MKNKIIYTVVLFALLLTASAMAQSLSGKKIFIEPGHDGYITNPNVETIPYALGNQSGFWESTANLRKGLALRDMLLNVGANVQMSRTTTSQTQTLTLSAIAEMANNFGANVFVSIHSKAGGEGTSANYPTILFNGTDAAPTYTESLSLGCAVWNKLYDNPITVWSRNSMNVRGDRSYLGYNLGVLVPLTRPGISIEGSIHDYKPETHRLLSSAYCKMEAYNIFRGICTHFRAGISTKGAIVGWVKDNKKQMTDPRYLPFMQGTDDEWTPINGAKVDLILACSGTLMQTCTVDNNWNGVFGFFDVFPGTYYIRLTAPNYFCKRVWH